MYNAAPDQIRQVSPFKQYALSDGGCHTNDYPFRDVWVWFTGGLGNDYNKALDAITKRANWNSGWGCRIAPGSDCYDTAVVECVLNAYTNLAREGKIPEYEWHNQAMKETIENTIAANTQVAIGKVKRVMAEVYWGTQDGDVPGFVLKPVTADRTAGYGQRPDGSRYEESDVPNPMKIIGTVVKYLPHIVIGAGILVGGYYASQIMSAVRPRN